MMMMMMNIRIIVIIRTSVNASSSWTFTYDLRRNFVILYYLDDYYSTIVISKQRLDQYEPCLLLNMSNVDDKECISVIAGCCLLVV